MSAKVDKQNFVLKYIAVVTLVFSVVQYVYNQRVQYNKDNSIRSLEYIDEYTSGVVATRVAMIRAFWRDEVPAVVKHSRSLTARDGARAFEVFIKNNKLYRGYDDALLDVMSHIDTVAFCARASVCSTRLILEFYCPEARRISKLLEFSEAEYRSQAVATGQIGLRYFHENCRNS